MKPEETIVISYSGTIEEWAEMLKVKDYKEELNDCKRALNDIKVSLESIDEDNENMLVLSQEFELFIRKELPEILRDLNLD